jgi:hypothetical protein
MLRPNKRDVEPKKEEEEGPVKCSQIALTYRLTWEPNTLYTETLQY